MAGLAQAQRGQIASTTKRSSTPVRKSSWYYYLEGKISLPFRAKSLAANAVSPLRKEEAVEVLQMAVEGQCEHDTLVQIRWQGRKMAVLCRN